MTDRRMLWIGVGNAHRRPASPGHAEHGRKFPECTADQGHEGHDTIED
jgi:hypothetical protein